MFSNRKIILIVILLITLSVSAYVIFVFIPSTLAERTYQGARKITDDIRSAFRFTPEVTVNNRVIIQQEVEVFELATLAETFQHQYEWKNTWMGSTKKINIRGTFQAKAGFDLHKKFTIQIEDDKAIVVMAKPQILSLTLHPDVTFYDENGVWNWVNATDRSAAVNAFTRDAFRYANQAHFVSRAQESMEKKLKAILTAHGKEVVIRYEDTPAVERL